MGMRTSFLTAAGPSDPWDVIECPPDTVRKSTPGTHDAGLEPVEPLMYNVFLLNDNTTPFPYVTEMLSRHFNLSAQRAGQVMWAAHRDGLSLVATMPKDVAETKVHRCNGEARATQNPVFNRPMELTFSAEPT